MMKVDKSIISFFFLSELDDCIQSAISYPNGDKYEGQMKLGVPEGRGRLVKANGEIYEGSFINGTPSGESAAEEKVFLSNIRKGIIKKDENDGKKMDENDERGKKA